MLSTKFKFEDPNDGQRHVLSAVLYILYMLTMIYIIIDNMYNI